MSFFQKLGDATKKNRSLLCIGLDSDPEKLPQGVSVLDFNRAINPPCAFTPYATCPLPPADNVLPVRIEAGEKTYSAH